MADSLRWMSWGLLLVALDFRIEGFDILPDFAGFLMIAYQLQSLKRREAVFAGENSTHTTPSPKIARRYNVAAILATVLAVLSLGDMATPLAAAGMDMPLNRGWMLYGAAGQLLMVFMVHTALTALESQLRERALPETAERVRLSRKWYNGMLWLLLLASPFILNAREATTYLLLPLGAVMFIMELLLFFTWRRVAKVLDGQSQEGPEA
ncbi:hypothetical protein WMW72_22990 [Paenibacillus filicis]|uniref:DUF1211 domain-containing protein n=1 Tax=Paenibacillus filicis TaxID=669464 RepID=A0ABU9DPI9_9BACL